MKRQSFFFGGRRSACVAALASGLAFSGTGAAFGADLLSGGSGLGEYSFVDTVLYWGFDLSRASSSQYGLGADVGFVTALNGNIAVSGWTMSANLGVSRSVHSPAETDSITGSVLLGYQWHTPQYYLALNAGVHVVNNDDNPPGGITDGTDVGAIVQYGFETKAANALYLQSYGAASTAFDQLYLHAKLGYNTGTLKYGAEFTASDDEGSSATFRYGGFIGGIPVGSLSMVVSAGYQAETQAGKSDGFYTQLGFSVPLSLR